jgi:hypothetical protein
MNSLPISANFTPALPGAAFGSHHRGGHSARVDAESLLSAGQPGELPAGRGQGRCNTTAMPWPTPMHIETTA